MNSFIPGQLAYPADPRDRIAPILVLEASPDPNCRNGSWLVTIMRLGGSTPLYNVRMYPRFWVTSPP